MIAVRAYAPADLEAVERVVAAAYEAPLSPDLHARLTHGASALVAERDGVVIGCVLLSDYGPVGYVGSMAVDPGAQRSGAGRALMEALLAQTDADGPPVLALDASDVGAPLYAKLGFVEIDRTVVYERAKPVLNRLERFAPHPSIAYGETAERIVELDREILGCDRGETLAMLTRQLDVTAAVSANGYAMTRGEQLGPWIARDPATARRLFQDAMRANPRVTRAFVPESNEAALAIAREAGFLKTRHLSHMVRGSPLLPRQSIYAQISLGHG